MIGAVRVTLLLSLAFTLRSTPLEGTEPLEMRGDPAEQMVAEIKRYLLRATQESIQSRKPTSERLAHILGVVDRRVPFEKPEAFAPLGSSSILATSTKYAVHAVRWSVLEGLDAEGILIEPSQPSRGFVVAIPDADQEPEQFLAAQQLAAAGFTVLTPSLTNREDTHSGKPSIRMTNQPHREWLYRMTYPLGRHILGLEVQKVLAGVDWFTSRSNGKPIGVWGYGEGGALALYAAAIDRRITAVGVAGYFGPRENLWREPIYRNVWGLLRDFGDAELATLIAPRRLFVDNAPGPRVAGPPSASPQRTGAAPGVLEPFEPPLVEKETRRVKGAQLGKLADFIRALGGDPDAGVPPLNMQPRDKDGRQKRWIEQVERLCDRLVERSGRERQTAWEHAKPGGIRNQLRTELIGELPQDLAPLQPRTREIPPGKNWRGYEVTLNAAREVFAYGVLLVPANLQHGQKLPVVVMQHGLDGRPQDLYNQTSGRALDVYQNVGQRLVDEGFVVYLPQNPYIHDFRPINRMANPLGLTLFSFILRQHEKTVAWLRSLPFVDGSRIGFYGLSYGGTTALRIPPLIDAYAVSICSGNFNEWVRKLTTTTESYSYMFTREYEIFEFNLAHVASHAEMGMLTAPRPFMVERGHADGVGIDEWVAYEFAKVARYYDRLGLADRTSIAYFEGPHRIDGVAVFAFLKRFLLPEKR